MNKTNLNSIWTALWLAFLALWLFYFAGDGLRADFTHDDLMNGYRATARSWPEMLGDIVMFFRHSPLYRPAGEVLYKACFDLFGYLPGPTRNVSFALVILNTWLLYGLISILSADRITAAVGSLLYAYLPGLNPIYYSTGVCYDVLALFFYLSGLLVYVTARQKNQPVGIPRGIAICLLYVLAMDSKEVAVTFPIALGLYELCWHAPKDWHPARLVAWVWSNCKLVAVTGAMTAAFVVGRVYAPQGIGRITGGYSTQISVAEYVSHAAHFLGEIVTLRERVLPWHGLIVFGAMGLIALVFRRPEYRFGLLWFLFGILPVAFIPARGLDAAIIPLCGFALSLAVLIVRLLAAVLPSRAPAPRFAPILIVAVLLYRAYRVPLVGTPFEEERIFIRSIQQQMVSLYPSLPLGTRVLFVDDPYVEHPSYSILFQMRLIYDNPNLAVDQKWRLEEEGRAVDPSKYDLILRFADKKLSVERGLPQP